MRSVRPSYSIPAPWPLFRGNGFDDQCPASGFSERSPRVGDRACYERLHFGPTKNIRRIQSNEASLTAGTKEDFLGVRKTGTVDEAETETACTGCHGNDGIGCPLRRGITDDEEVVIVVDQFIGGGEPPPENLADSPDESLMARLKFGNEAVELSFSRARSAR